MLKSDSYFLYLDNLERKETIEAFKPAGQNIVYIGNKTRKLHFEPDSLETIKVYVNYKRAEYSTIFILD